MKLIQLQAEEPIVKRYTKNQAGAITKTSYPLVSRFTSTEHQVTTPEEFHQAVQNVASQHGCLLKGALTRPLINESRAGSTIPDLPTQWVCLDIDGLPYSNSIDQLLIELGIRDTSYILQWSASAGLDSTRDLRCHILFMLAQPQAPGRLKQWLIHQNLNLETLSQFVQLTKSGNSLTWPLDITTCQNDKLIYVAPPILGPGITDPHPSDRISLVKHANSYLSLKLDEVPLGPDLRHAIDKKVNARRLTRGLSPRPATKFKFDGPIEYMANPIAAQVTGIKEERGFVYLNLNGGDSYGYYHPIGRPEFIFNFKGEPTYKTSELLPAYNAKAMAERQTTQLKHGEKVYLAFRDTESSNYYTGWYDQPTDHLELHHTKSKDQVRDFLKEHKQPIGEFIPSWTMVFEPHQTWRVDPANRLINTFSPTKFFQHAPTSTPKTLPPITQKIVDSALGGDPVVVDRFLNWLACIMQYRDRTQTAWILHGTQGTGKGLLFHHILTPILGERYCKAKRFEELESEFTEFLENVFLTMIDEVSADRGKNSVYHSKIDGKLKNLIVEPYINVRRMYHAAKPVKNFNNMIFTSNNPMPVRIDPDDRRFNVGGYQLKRLVITNTEVNCLETELQGVYDYLMTRPANRDLARVPLNNSARTTIIDINRPAVDVVSDAILSGNLEFFWDQLPNDKATSTTSGPGLNTLRLDRFRSLVIELVNSQPGSLSRDDLFALYEYCVGNMPESPNKFTSLLKHHRIYMTTVWKNGRSVRGVNVKWHADPAWLTQAQTEIAQNLI